MKKIFLEGIESVLTDIDFVQIHNQEDYAYCTKEALDIASKTLSHTAFKMWILLIEKGYPYFGGEAFYKAVPMDMDEIDLALDELVKHGYLNTKKAPVLVYEYPQKDEVEK